MKNPLKRVFLILAVALTVTHGARANTEVYEKVLPSTGLILVPQDKDKIDLGTCWVVDQERKLVITNNHVVKDKTEVFVYFPMFAGDEVIPLRDHYFKAGKKIAGQVIHRDVSRDLALVRLESLPPSAKSLNLAAKSVKPGATVHSIGNSGFNNGVLWRYTRGQVRMVVPYKLQLETGLINTTVIETAAPINHGDSGGPLVNDRGEVVGVVSAFDTQKRLITWNIEVREVRLFLASARQAENAEVTIGR